MRITHETSLVTICAHQPVDELSRSLEAGLRGLEDRAEDDGDADVSSSRERVDHDGQRLDGQM